MVQLNLVVAMHPVGLYHPINLVASSELLASDPVALKLDPLVPSNLIADCPILKSGAELLGGV